MALRYSAPAKVMESSQQIGIFPLIFLRNKEKRICRAFICRQIRHFVEPREEEDDEREDDDVVIERQHGFSFQCRAVIVVDKGEERDDQRGPADNLDIGFGKDVPVIQPLVGAVEENAAQDEKQHDADETGGQDEDLPAFDVRVPVHGRETWARPEQGNHLHEGVDKGQAANDENGDGEVSDALLCGIFHKVVIYVLPFPRTKIMPILRKT